ncbi:MAG: tRNA (N(6)-L-threonylcarbamoyladenosine(37)-C(2))-methylthiotransferase MtaB [Clostridia bacterium]|nr:tRNA (N(6)-L-threonylcarbamoyladenosine(37)-C(2))-methylthiotransferase MtaB [Clostridia bacterium]
MSAYTLGCKVNQYETEAISELFKQSGYTIVDFNSAADVYVINTCTVTNMSDRKSRQIIRRAKKTNPNAVIVVTGCYAQTAPDDVLGIDGVNLIIGTKDRKDIVGIVEKLSKEDKVSKVGNIMDTHTFEQLNVNEYTDRTRAYIKIQEGCSQFCTYCIIPYARGPVRSRDFDDIIKEIKALAYKGFSEIVLAGIHVASYCSGDKTLSDLLIAADKIDGIKRIRLSSIEPMTLDTSFINKIKDCSKLCHHFHISLQSGCDSVLKRMNRKYDTTEYKQIVCGLRDVFPNCAITTDIMVGFPGETEKEFQETVDFVTKINFADAHIFQYSPRKGTPAAKMKEKVPPEVKEARSKIIAEIIKESRLKFLKDFIGKEVEVLFEQPFKDDFFEGKTSNYITVIAPTDEDLSGQFKKVLLESVEDSIVRGIIRE